MVDNSGRALAAGVAGEFGFATCLRNATNAGYGAAANRAFREYPAEYLGVLNDDTVLDPDCLEALIAALDANPRAGMAAPLILLAGAGQVDSAGMSIARDGSAVQRGHSQPAGQWAEPGEALLPSGCAAIYRAEMLSQTGLFDESLFLYHEDTDLGLRGRWAGWGCLYVPSARLEHWYSSSSGRATALKAWYVERNRLRVVARLFPWSWLLAAPFFSLLRYCMHVLAGISGRGKARESRVTGVPFWELPWIVVKAHIALVPEAPRLMRLRRATACELTPAGQRALLRRFRATLWEVATH